MKPIWMGLMAGAAWAGLACAAAAADYTVLITGRPAGTMTVTGIGAERSVAYSYNDRGRGPDLKETFRVGPDGMLESASINGVDYLKAPVDESFARTGGKSAWSSQADAGSSAANAFYSTYQGTPEDGAALMRALLKAPGQQLD